MDDGGRVIVEATVITVGDGPFYYPACKHCYSKLVCQTENFCPKCRKVKRDSEVNQRYRLRLTISDGLSLTIVTVFGNTLAPYFGCSATDFHKWNGQFSQQITPCVLKSAVDKTMVGSTFLFGFKGRIKKSKGTRVTLKDIENLKCSNASDPPWNRDLVAFQIMSQCDLQHPIPVVTHLQNLLNYFQSNKEDHDLLTTSHDFISRILSDLDNANSLETTPKKLMPPVHCEGSIDFLESDMSINNYSLSSAEKEGSSIGLGLTLSTQNSQPVEDSVNVSEADSLKSRALCGENNLTPSKYGNFVLNHNKSMRHSVSSRRFPKSSWCVQSWLRKHGDWMGRRESVSEKDNSVSGKDNSVSEKDNSNNSVLGVAHESYNSLDLFSSPEKARDTAFNNNMSSSSGLLSNFSIVDDIVVSLPSKRDKNKKSSINTMSLSKEFNEIQSYGNSGNLESGKRPNVLALKKGMCNVGDDNFLSPSIPKDKNISSIGSGKGDAFNNGYFADANGNSQNSKDRCRSSFSDIPESEDFDLFMAAMESEPLVCKAVSLALPSKCDRSTETVAVTKLSSMNVRDKNVSPPHESFIDMPESEDFDIFLAAVNLEQLQLDSKSCRASAEIEVAYGETVHHDVIDVESKEADSKSTKLTSNHPDSFVAMSVEEMSSNLLSLDADKIISSQKSKYGDDDEIVPSSFYHFDDSCDLFDSPAPSGIPCYYNHALEEKPTTVTSNSNSNRDCSSASNRDDQNDSCSLFSSSPSSSQEKCVFPPSHQSPNHVKDLQNSFCCESFMDLFSQASPITGYRRPGQTSSQRTCFTSSSSPSFYCQSPDLFSSPI